MQRNLWSVKRPLDDNTEWSDLPFSFLTGRVGRPLLPQQAADVRGRKTLVVDLDETLVCPGTFRSRREWLVRPFAVELLELAFDLFELVIWTLSSYEYALEKTRALGISGCKLIAGLDSSFKGVKDLRQLGRDMSQILLIDDSVRHFAAQPRCVLRVTEWGGDRSDTALAEILDHLVSIADSQAVQHVHDAFLTKQYGLVPVELIHHAFSSGLR